MHTLHIPIPTGLVSDGYHTFDELYNHRHALFMALMKAHQEASWYSLNHNDGTTMDGWFIAGIDLESGTITYHLPIRLITFVRFTNAIALEKAPKWDGHTSGDVIERILSSL